MKFELGRRWFFCLVCAGLIIISGSACSSIKQKPGRTIQAGDEILISFACYTPDERLIIATDMEKAFKTGVAGSDLFLPPAEPGPMPVTAGDEAVKEIQKRFSPEFFDIAVAAYLAKEIVGKPFGQEHRLVLDADVQEGLTREERFLRLTRRVLRDRQKWFSKAMVEKEYGKPPEVGDVFTLADMPGMSFKILEIKDDQALGTWIFEDGMVVKDPWGPQRFAYLDENTYSVTYETEVGYVGRAGALLGRVSSVEERFFWIDWGHPFGGQRLICDVAASELEKKE